MAVFGMEILGCIQFLQQDETPDRRITQSKSSSVNDGEALEKLRPLLKITSVTSLASCGLKISPSLTRLIKSREKNFFHSLTLEKQLTLLKHGKCSTLDWNNCHEFAQEIDVPAYQLAGWLKAIKSRYLTKSTLEKVHPAKIDILNEEFSLSETLSSDRLRYLSYVLKIDDSVIEQFFDLKRGCRNDVTDSVVTPEMPEPNQNADVDSDSTATSSTVPEMPELSLNMHGLTGSSRPRVRSSRYPTRIFPGKTADVTDSRKIISQGQPMILRDRYSQLDLLDEAEVSSDEDSSPERPKNTSWDSSPEKPKRNSKPRNGFRFSPEQLKFLQDRFAVHEHIFAEEAEDIATRAFSGTVRRKTVINWFNNARCKKKLAENMKPPTSNQEGSASVLKTPSSVQEVSVQHSSSSGQSKYSTINSPSTIKGPLPLAVQNALFEEYRISPTLTPKRKMSLHRRLDCATPRIDLFFLNLTTQLAGRNQSELFKLLTNFSTETLSQLTFQYGKNRFVPAIKNHILAKQLRLSPRAIFEWYNNARLYELVTGDRFSMDIIRAEKRSCTPSLPSTSSPSNSAEKSATTVSKQAASLLRNEYLTDPNITDERITTLSRHLRMKKDCIREWYKFNFPSSQTSTLPEPSNSSLTNTCSSSTAKSTLELPKQLARSSDCTPASQTTVESMEEVTS